MPVKRPLVLLDRDGTLITEQDYLKDPRQVKLLAHVVPGLRRLQKAGFPLVVISNQSGVGRGKMSLRDVSRVNARFQQILKTHGIRLKGIYYCPHHPRVSCACRKPKLKLVKQAARDVGRSWRGSISVGDKWSDVEMGRRTGGQGILVLSGYGRISRIKSPHRAADYVAANLNSAARWILKMAPKES